ncbi:hypothetical protein PFISCL1PPCAC_3779, partial [Pristionchus fissidentatus]
RSFSRAIPLTVALLQLTAASMSIINLLTLTTNYPINLVVHLFLASFGSPMASLIPQLVLSVSPRGQRATAYALLTLVTGLVSSPAAQFVGLLSDTYRGEADDARTRFEALAFAFFVIVSFFFAASISYFIMMKYYPMDVLTKQVEDDLDQPLLSPFDVEERPLRSGSLVERALISRRATMETVYA